MVVVAFVVVLVGLSPISSCGCFFFRFYLFISSDCYSYLILADFSCFCILVLVVLVLMVFFLQSSSCCFLYSSYTSSCFMLPFFFRFSFRVLYFPAFVLCFFFMCFLLVFLLAVWCVAVLVIYLFVSLLLVLLFRAFSLCYFLGILVFLLLC